VNITSEKEAKYANKKTMIIFIYAFLGMRCITKVSSIDFFFKENKYEITTNKEKFYSTILRILPTATVRPSSRNVNRPS
jgi:hypothetical protein